MSQQIIIPGSCGPPIQSASEVGFTGMTLIHGAVTAGLCEGRKDEAGGSGKPFAPGWLWSHL